MRTSYHDAIVGVADDVVSVLWAGVTKSGVSKFDRDVVDAVVVGSELVEFEGGLDVCEVVLVYKPEAGVSQLEC